MQVSVIVAGILVADIVGTVWEADDLALPTPIVALTSYGFLFLILPLGWTALAVWTRQRQQVPEAAKSAVFVLGVLMLLAMAGSVTHAVLDPWSHLDWLSGGE